MAFTKGESDSYGFPRTLTHENSATLPHFAEELKEKLDAARASGNEPQIEARAEHWTGELR